MILMSPCRAFTRVAARRSQTILMHHSLALKLSIQSDFHTTATQGALVLENQCVTQVAAKQSCEQVPAPMQKISQPSVQPSSEQLPSPSHVRLQPLPLQSSVAEPAPSAIAVQAPSSQLKSQLPAPAHRNAQPLPAHVRSQSPALHTHSSPGLQGLAVTPTQPAAMRTAIENAAVTWAKRKGSARNKGLMSRSVT
jgi:hypothetical protein